MVSRKTGTTLRAVINDTDNIYANGAIDAILSYYNYSALIGQTTDVGFETADLPNNIKYNKYLSEHFSNRFREGTLFVDSSHEVYRRILSDAADKSVVLITIGFLNTAAEALSAMPLLLKARFVVW